MAHCLRAQESAHLVCRRKNRATPFMPLVPVQPCWCSAMAHTRGAEIAAHSSKRKFSVLTDSRRGLAAKMMGGSVTRLNRTRARPTRALLFRTGLVLDQHPERVGRLLVYARPRRLIGHQKRGTPLLRNANTCRRFQVRPADPLRDQRRPCALARALPQDPLSLPSSARTFDRAAADSS